MSRTRAEDYSEKKTQIRTLSKALFAQQGYHVTSMSEVAHSCGISKGLLYHYYKSKDALLFDILESHLVELTEAVEETASDLRAKKADTETILLAIIRTLLSHYSDRDDDHRLQLAEMKSLSPDKQDILRALEKRIIEPVNQVVTEEMIKHNENAVYAKPSTMSLFGILNWCFLWFRDDGALNREEYAKMVAKLFLNGIRSLSAD
ncbi:MAG: TetR/AcrR family transcriptional regulator [Alphaproteobacteria bacterium]|nr:TetR/AcrR family transcriptional regulator [Alphaproteobacteria bacterium]